MEEEDSVVEATYNISIFSLSFLLARVEAVCKFLPIVLFQDIQTFPIRRMVEDLY
jgi:hypothetical protein